MTRDIPDTRAAAGDSALVVAEERNRLSQALLEATAALARGREPDDILRMVCDALSASTSHIRLAWMVLGDLDAEVLRPQYASGPAREYTESLAIERGTPAAEAPSRRAVGQWEPQTSVIADDPSFDKMRLQAQHWSLKSVLTLPLGRRKSPRAGLVSIYADRPDYFSVIGQDLFSAFAHVVNASLEQSELMQTLSHLANHDQLTDLLNRRGIEELLERELARSRRHREPFSIALFDVDRFKLINDSLGHRRGDAVLKRLAASAQQLLRQEDVLARWGGEEFLCLLPETGRDHAWAVAERMRHAIEESPLEIPGGNQNVTVSFGVATCPDDGPDLDKLVAAADAALYQAKSSGRNRTAAAHTLAQPLYSVGSMLDTALREGRIVPAYQPIVELASGRTVAEEALARALTPDGALIEAGQFIEAASQLQLLHRIDQTIMQQGFEHCVAGLKTGANVLNHFVNVSADLLRHQDLVRSLLGSARAHCAGCEELTGPVKPMIIEITERELVRDIDAARELLQPFIEFGLRLALDDFGSGYSSYQYLADLPVSFLKIDGQLVRRLNEPKVRAIVQGIQDTAQQLGLTTLAECVESREIEAVLQDIGVHWGQGYYYGKPCVADRIRDT